MEAAPATRLRRCGLAALALINEMRSYGSDVEVGPLLVEARSAVRGCAVGRGERPAVSAASIVTLVYACDSLA